MFVAGSRPLRTHEGRSGIPGCSSGRTARTVPRKKFKSGWLMLL
jgi:hypothetical protein